MVEIILRRGLIGCTPKQRKTLFALGLKKPNSKKIFPDTPSLRGMLKIVEHLVEVHKQ